MDIILLLLVIIDVMQSSTVLKWTALKLRDWIFCQVFSWCLLALQLINQIVWLINSYIVELAQSKSTEKKLQVLPGTKALEIR